MTSLLQAVLSIPWWAAVVAFLCCLFTGVLMGVLVVLVLQTEARRRRHWRAFNDEARARRQK